MHDDIELLRNYVNGSESAFQSLVERHIGLVYSTARRLLNDPELANDVTQTVFVILARKAPKLKKGTVLSGWLYRTTRFAAMQMLRARLRRERREDSVMAEQSTEAHPSAWEQIAPYLDEALARLSDGDRNALTLRFLENRTLEEVGRTLGITEDAARMRVNRAVDRLRSIFQRRGLALSSSVLLTSLAGASTAHAVPAGLTSSVLATATLKGSATAVTPFVEATLKLIAMTKMKTTLGVTSLLLIVAVSSVLVTENLANDKPGGKPPAGKQPPLRDVWRRDDLTPEQRQQVAKMICLDNLKQLGAAAKQWSNTNGGGLPPNWMALRRFLPSPEFLVCVSDTNKVAAADWAQVNSANITYELVSPNLKQQTPNTIVAKCSIHGHVVLSTGQAFQGDYIRKNGLKIVGNKLE